MTWVFQAWLALAWYWPLGAPLPANERRDPLFVYFRVLCAVSTLIGVPLFFPFVLLFEGLFWLLGLPQRLVERAYWGKPAIRRNGEGQLVARLGTRKPKFYVAYWGTPPEYSDACNLWKGVEHESPLERYLDRHAEVFIAEEKRLFEETQHAALFNTNTEIDSAGLLSLAPAAEAMPRLPQVTGLPHEEKA